MITRLKKMIGARHPIRLGWHYVKSLAAAVIYGFPARKLTVIGVTGTDGKTTTVSMISHILTTLGVQNGALSTAFFKINNHTEWNATQKTSPSPFAIQKFLRRLVDEGCTHAVLEVSSHGLVQSRLNWTFPSVAGITNTSMEHLDYHKTMKQYRLDKMKLFQMIGKSGTKVLNTEDKTFQPYSKLKGTTLSYGRGGDLSVSDVSSSHTSSTCRISYRDFKSDLALHIPGRFNLENAQCAISCCITLGLDLRDCAQALSSFKGTPGRMEAIDEGQPFTVFVDFTVTPVAYEKTLASLRDSLEAGKRLLVLTGSCGDRMREKRPLVGKICSELADIIVVTNEDPYTEDPQKIIDEVWVGIDQSKCEAHQIFDRREAMDWLFGKAQAGDIVILCAKGSDTTMYTAEGQIPWDDREVARELLSSFDQPQDDT